MIMDAMTTCTARATLQPGQIYQCPESGMSGYVKTFTRPGDTIQLDRGGVYVMSYDQISGETDPTPGAALYIRPGRWGLTFDVPFATDGGVAQPAATVTGSDETGVTFTFA